VDNGTLEAPWTTYHTMIDVTGDDEGLFTMNNCTFANNVAEAAVVSFANTQLRNTIFADSVSRYEIWMPVEDSYHNVYELDVDYCNIRGGMNSVMVEYPNTFIWGEHNIDADPLFVGGDSMDPNSFRLSADSPCINAGSPDTTGLPTLDLAGNLRVWDGRVDMGCYEYGSLQAAPTEQTAPEYAMMFSNSPNPFNAETEITFYLDHDQPERITLDIYNIKGQRVKTLFNGKLGIGFHKILWEGDNDGGSEVSSGVYLCRLHTEKVTLFHKMTLLK